MLRVVGFSFCFTYKKKLGYPQHILPSLASLYIAFSGVACIWVGSGRILERAFSINCSHTICNPQDTLADYLLKKINVYVIEIIQKIRMNIYHVIFCVVLHRVNAGPCDISGGRNEIILDVTESTEQEYNQTIEPQELPIEGDPTTEIVLELPKKWIETFSLTGKSMRLNRPLDRDADDQSTLLFEVTCGVRESTQRINIPVILRIHDLNDNTPQFIGTPYEVTLKEDSSVSSPIFKGIRAEDRDSGRNGQVEYHILEVNPASGSELFKIRFPHQGVVFLESPLDYETSPDYYITVLATDYAVKPTNRRNTTTVLTIHVEDVDDQDPIFDTALIPPGCPNNKIPSSCIPEYRSTITEGEIAGVLDVYPNRIHAKDLDSLGATIIYSFESGTPSTFRQYFDIDPRTAVVSQKKIVDKSQIKGFEIIIQALERTRRTGKAIAVFRISVLDVDTSPPVVIIPSYTGKVPEGSEVGTIVLRDDESQQPFIFSVTDPDIDKGEVPPNYVFELTTSAFKITREGALVVASADLDRDPPNLPEHTFQVIAREDKEGGAASSPVRITVRLLDINDNPPTIPVLPTIRLPAGSQKRSVLKLQASDKDDGDNAIMRYELLSGGMDKFSVDSKTGEIIAYGDLKAGEEFFLNIKVSDSGNLSSEAYLKVIVARGPNTSGPVFSQPRYSATVPEDIPYGGSVLSVQAYDPDGDSSYYSILGGAGKETFEIDTLTGVITAVAPLDRETNDEFHLTIKAEDSERKSNTATVTIGVIDVNDENPKFIGEPYSFRVDEGLINATVGTVKAEDRDLNKSGQVSYMIEGKQPLFFIDSYSGEIFTNTALDYEKEQVHYVSVVAHDNAENPLSSTTSITILVNDVNDEVPVFQQKLYSVQVLENTAVGSVLLTVTARDPDTKPSITYKLVEGDARLFKVAPDTGRVTLAGHLDYETEANYTLIIGTEESNEAMPGSRTTVAVHVDDVNDEPPILAPLHTITFPKAAPLQTLLVTVSASDADGSKPNKEIVFSFLEEDEAALYFNLDPEKGEIRLTKSLKEVNVTELLIRVKAKDKGDPSLSASGEFRVLLLDEVIPEGSFEGDYRSALEGDAKFSTLASSPRFPKDFFDIQVTENIPVGSVVLKVPLINSSALIACSVVDGNDEEIFVTKVTRDGFCKIITTKVLDYELHSVHNLSLALHPAGIALNDSQELERSTLSKAFVRFNIIDMNDNAPSFLLKDFDILRDDPQDTILSYALQDYRIDTEIIQLKALDFDSGKQGMVEYKLLPESNRGNYFSVDPKTGRIYTKRNLVNVPLELQPFNLTLVAEDQPGLNGTQHTSIINVIIPVIEESYRYVLVLDAPKQDVDGKVRFLKKILSETTGRIAQTEYVKQVRAKDADEGSGFKATTQVWFHLLDPSTWEPDLLEMNDKEKSMILQDISSSLDGIKAVLLATPAEVNQIQEEELKEKPVKLSEAETEGSVTRLSLAESLGPIEYVLLVVACLIIFYVICAIIITCALWSRFSRKWNRADKTVMLIPPLIERPGSVLDTISKEYEVQVLHMSIPVDDESVPEAVVEAESTRQYCLDNVSYISKSHNGREGSSSAGSSCQGTPRHFGGNGGYSRWSPETPMEGNFEHYPREYFNDDHGGTLSASSTNENVLFGKRGFPEPSPVETTTEL